MAELSTLARPYAKAAFDYAYENSVVGEWEDFLFIATTLVNDAACTQMLDDPAISAAQKVHMLIGVYNEQVATAAETPLKTLLLSHQNHKQESATGSVFSEVSAALTNFVQQLAEQERLKLLPQIYAQYRLQRAKTLKQVDAYITSAYPLTDAQRLIIQKKLETSLNAAVILHEAVDASLIGGATIKIGDRLVDDSIRGKLKQLKSQLIA